MFIIIKNKFGVIYDFQSISIAIFLINIVTVLESLRLGKDTNILMEMVKKRCN
jgi:hypothetical protein